MSDTTRVHSEQLITDGDMVVRAFQKDGTFEPETWKAWMNWVREHDGAAIDAGCYTGLYAMGAARYASPVFAFEPVKEVADRFFENIANSEFAEPIEFYPVAVLDKATIISMKPPNANRLTSGSKVVDLIPGRDVWAVALDEFLPKHLRYVAMKFDVEGSEEKAVRGAMATIERDRPLVVVECLNDVVAKKVTDLMPSEYECKRADHRNLIFTPA